MRVHKEISVGICNKIPPPVNNACVPDIYDKLDVNAIEKTKVLNMQLSFKLKLQEKVLSKYRDAVEQRYTRERDKLRNDLRNIGHRLPNYADIPHLENKVKKLHEGKRAIPALNRDCVFTTEPLDMKGISEKDEKPFCDRFLIHHLPTKSRFYQDALQSVRKGMSMPDLRLRVSDQYRRVVPIKSTHDSLSSLTKTTLSPLTQKSLFPKLIPIIKSLDDNFVPSKARLFDDDDDIKTV